MITRMRVFLWLIFTHAALAGSMPCIAQQVKLVERPPDPHGSPRPARGARNVPLRTSIYFELETSHGAQGGDVRAESVSVSLQPEGGARVEMLRSGGRFAEGCRGWLRPKHDLQGKKSLAVYVEPNGPLVANKTYSMIVTAGGGQPAPAATHEWSFTTEAAPANRPVNFTLDLKREPLHWHGRFFSGICNVIFCTQAANYEPTFDLMAEARKQHPKAWSYQRDFWMTGTEYRPPGFLAVNLPNLVRERETRRIAAIEPRAKTLVLRVEDFFGHRQYGIADGRPVGDDYHPGEEVLIADGVHDARTKVIAVDSAAGTVSVEPVPSPQGGWKIAYDGPLPDREDPDAPGLFAPGGCYLRKFKPHGTACYYWGRLDKEWDLAHRRYGRRLLPNLADAPGDLSRDGRSWTTVKDYAQWHEVARTIAGHVIDRYGADALSFTWSVFNEPDLAPLFWRADWNDLQTFYDYTTDAVLRAFEDRGYASDKVFIGGLELGGIFGVHLRLNEFLAHCSPTASAKGALPRNAAFADSRLDGKRSRRVELLCRQHSGKGTPCDFISIHSYDKAELMAAKLARAKEVALEIDPDYYRPLWVNSHEACPDWMPPPDEAAADSYLGNGFFPTWCLDVVHRQLSQAAKDGRFAYGETILTVWPPPANFAGINAVSRMLHIDENGDGRGDGTVTVPMPVFHALGLLSDLGDHYWVLPAQEVGGHRIGGFASRDDAGVLRVVLYTHQPEDTQSRSAAMFDVKLELKSLAGEAPVRVEEFPFDRDRNSPFKAMRVLRDRPSAAGAHSPARLAELIRGLESRDRRTASAALDSLHTLDAAARQAAVPALLKLAGQTQDQAVRDLANDVIKTVFAPKAYSRPEIEAIQKQCECRSMGTARVAGQTDGRVLIATRVAGNGCVFLKIVADQVHEPDDKSGR